MSVNKTKTPSDRSFRRNSILANSTVEHHTYRLSPRARGSFKVRSGSSLPAVGKAERSLSRALRGVRSSWRTVSQETWPLSSQLLWGRRLALAHRRERAARRAGRVVGQIGQIRRQAQWHSARAVHGLLLLQLHGELFF